MLDFPDGGLANLDPRDLEARRRPAPSTAHGARRGGDLRPPRQQRPPRPRGRATAVVKRAFCAAREAGGPQRLALFTLVEGEIEDNPVGLQGVPREDLGAVVTFSDADRQRAERALDCYETYAEVIAEHRPLRQVAGGVPFVLFQETHETPLDSLTDGLRAER